MPKRKLNNVTQRADGRWMARKTFGRNPDGSYIRKSFYGSTAAEAAARLDEYERQVSSGLDSSADEVTFGQWLSIWLREYKMQALRPHTYDTYEQFVKNHIAPALGNRKLLKITPQMLQAFFNSLKKENGDTMSVSTVKQIRVIVSGAFKQAVKNGLLTRNPSDALSLPITSGKKKVGAYTPNEQNALLRVPEAHRLYALFVLALGTGMRIGELLALHWSDIELEQKEITVSKSVSRSKDRDSHGNVISSSVKVGDVKTASGFRVVPLTDDLVRVLKRHQSEQAAERERAVSAWEETDLVFCTALGGRLEYRNVVRLYTARRDAAGLPPLSFHSLRHSFATNAIVAGLDYYYLSRIMGHANISITLDTYTDFMPDKSRHEMSKLEGALLLKADIE